VSDNETPKQQTPTEFMRETITNLVTRPVRASAPVRTVSTKTATTGSQAGQHVIDDLTIPAHDDESDSEWLDRWEKVFARVVWTTAKMNADAYKIQADAVLVEGKR